MLVNSLPWSYVTVDGQPKGLTHWAGSLSQGTHRIHLRTEDGKTHTTELTVTGEEIVRYCWSFEADALCLPSETVRSNARVLATSLSRMAVVSKVTTTCVPPLAVSLTSEL